MLQLRVAGSDKTYALTKKTVIGSDSSADIVLEGDEIRPTHCILTAAGARVMLMVLDPSAQVQVNGAQALQKALKAGDTLLIGGIALSLEDAAAADAAQPAGAPLAVSGATLPPADLPPKDLPHPGTAATPIALVLKQGPGAGRQFPIDSEVVTIGRDPKSTVVLDDQRVSANHAKLVRAGGVWTFSDVGSSGGSRVNGIKVASIPVSDGDELQLGESVLAFREKGPALPVSMPAPASAADTSPRADESVELPAWDDAAATAAIGKIADTEMRAASAPAIGGNDSESTAPPIGGDDAASSAPPIGGADAASKAPLLDAAADDSAATPLPDGAGADAIDATAPLGLRLEMINGPSVGAVFELRSGITTLGRAPDCDIVIGEPSVSGKHGEIRVEGSRVTFTDTNSSAGSKVNSITVDSLALEPGDELTLGTEVVLVLRAAILTSIPAVDTAGDDAAVTPGPRTDPAAAAVPVAPLPAPQGPVLRILKGPGKNTDVAISKEVTSVGRAPDCDLVINEPSVSGKHGEFRWGDGRLQYADTGSSAGSKVNGITVDALPLEQGDEVQLGTVSLLRVDSLGVAAVLPEPVAADPDPGATPAPAPSAAAASELPKRGVAAGSTYTLVGTSAGIDGRIFAVRGECVIGTAADAQIALPPESGAGERHAMVFEGPTGPAIRRLPGAAAVLVQGVSIELLPLAHGDVIGLGQAQFIVRGSGRTVVRGGGAAPKSAGTDVIASRYRVVVRNGAHAGTTAQLVGLLRVGRDPRCDLVLSDAAVSGNHCEIAPVAGGWTVRDVGSSAGTFLGDLKVVTDMAVKHGTIIRCGDVDLLFEDTEAALALAAATPAPAVTPAKPLPAKLTGVRRRPRGADPTAGEKALLVVTGTDRGVRWEFADRVTIGRLDSNDIALENPEVSGEHARLRLHDGGVLLEDRGSTNGTRVNDEPVNTKLLQHGDVVEIQDYEFMYLEPGQPVPELDRYSRPSLIKLGDANKRLGRWRIPLTLTIGRAAVHNVVLADDTEVSGDHAKIVDRSGQFFLIDTSSNGTRVNGKKVKSEIRLHHGDVIGIGAGKFAFKDAHKSLEVQELRGSQIGAMAILGLLLVVGLLVVGYIVVFPDTIEARERVNLLRVNFDFSEASADGGIPGWRFHKSEEVTAGVIPGGGAEFLEVRSGSGQAGPTSQFEAIYDGQLLYKRLNAYQLRGRIKAQGAETGGAALRLRFRQSDGTIFDRYTQWVADTNDRFLELSVTVRPPKGAAAVEVAAVTRGQAGIVRFDDIKLHEIPLNLFETPESRKKNSLPPLPNSESLSAADRFGTIKATVDTQGVVSLSRGDDLVFGQIFFQLRGMPGLGGQPLPRVDQLLSYTKSYDGDAGAVLIELVGFDFATGTPVEFSINVRPTTGAGGASKGGLLISAEFSGLTAHNSAGKVEGVLYFRGVGGREGKWTNRRRTSQGGFSESSNDFPAEIGVSHWVIGEGAGELAVAFDPEAVVLGTYVGATKSIDGVVQLAGDFQGGRLSVTLGTAGPDTAERHQVLTQTIATAAAADPVNRGAEFDAHAAFVAAFGWLTAEAAVSNTRLAAIAQELTDNLSPLRSDVESLITELEQSSAAGAVVNAAQKARHDELQALLAEFRQTYGVIPGAAEADALKTRLGTAMDGADQGAKTKIVVAVLSEARAAHAAGNRLKARILLEGLTTYQRELLDSVPEAAGVYALLQTLTNERRDADARDAAFDLAKKTAALAAASGDTTAAVAAWRVFLAGYPDPVGDEIDLSEKAKLAVRAIWELTHPK